MSEWEENPLERLTLLIKDGTHGTHKDVVNGIPLLSAKDIYHGKFHIEDDCRRISLEDYKKIHATYEFGLGDILLTVVGTIGRVAIISDISEKITFQRSVALIRFDSGIFPKFAYYQISSAKFVSLLERSMNASAQGGVYLGELAKINIYYPPLPHQRKIARILTTVDNIIEKTESAIEKYKTIKQGMMHDLFTRGIDVKTGKLRPSYEDAPELYKETELGMIPKEWEVKKIDDITENLDGQRIPIKQADRDKMEGSIPYYGASGIIDYVNEYIFDEPLILLGEDGENVVSRNLPLAFKIEGKSWVNNHAHVLRPNKGINIYFLTELLESLDYKDIISGSAQPKINQNNLSRKKVIKPNIKEQSTVTQIILSINKKIENEISFFDKNNKIKQALMQDLLTGKKEVTPDPEDFKAMNNEQ